VVVVVVVVVLMLLLLRAEMRRGFSCCVHPRRFDAFVVEKRERVCVSVSVREG